MRWNRCLPLVLVLSSVLAVAGLQSAAGETLRILIPRAPSVYGWGGPSDLDPVWDLARCLHDHLTAPWDFEILLEDVAPETLTTAWVLDRRMRGTLQDVAVVPLWLAKDLSERRLLVDLGTAPRIDPAYYRCDPWDPAVELPGWVRLADVSCVPYSDVTNLWSRREAIRIPGTGEYVIVLFEHDGIYENPEKYVCRRTAVIRNTLEILRHCIAQ